MARRAVNRRSALGSVFGGAAAGSLVADVSAAQVAGAPAVPGFNVRDFGAKGDGKTLDTAAIQAAIDRCTSAGGGVVYLPSGRFLSGTIVLKDNVTLHLSPGATLLGSPRTADYPAYDFPARDLDIGGFQVWALVYSEGARNVAIEGTGTIDGNGKPFVVRRPPRDRMDVPTAPRPRAVFLKGCAGVSVRDVTIREPGIWALHLALCVGVIVRGVTVSTHTMYNQDGIVIDSCDRVCISDCLVDAYDDAIVIKSSFPKPCQNVAISNCVLKSYCTAIKFGSQSLGGFRNVAISNCALHECRYGGLKFQTVDGGDLEDVTVSNISMHGVAAPIFFRLGNRGQDYGFRDVERPRPVARLRNVMVDGVRATVVADAALRNGHTMSVMGLRGHPIEGVTLANIHVTFPGGGTLADARRTEIPEREDAYPEHNMFGVLPAYGLYVRHARGVTLHNVRFECAAQDLRSALICDDVQDLELTGFKATTFGREPLLVLRQTRGALVQGSRALGSAHAFLAVEGAATRDIALLGNDLRQVRSAVVKTGGFMGDVPIASSLRA